MRRPKCLKQKLARRPKSQSQDGVALITTLLLLLLMTGMAVAMVFSVNSDMLINGYYRNFRGSFYAADSGLAIARQDLLNRINAAKLSAFSTTTQPIPAGTEAVVQSYIASTYGSSYQKIYGSGEAANSWPAKFKITNVSLTLANCTILGGGGTCAAPTGAVTNYKYTYNYSLTAKGQSQGTEEATITDAGSLLIDASPGVSAGTTTSFAAWGMFIDKSNICDGSYLVPGTISGPVFTNGAWNFGTGKYIFTDKVGSANSKAGYQFSSCYQSSANPPYYKAGSTSSNITVQGTFSLGENSVPLPDNDYNQQRAVIDGTGTDTAVSRSEMNSSLKTLNGSQYPASGTPGAGVYLPYTVDASGNKVLTGGGIYVQDTTSTTTTITLVPGSGTSQIYKIKQGSTTTTITITPSGGVGQGTTTVSDGSSTITISGVPTQRDPATGNPTANANMLYVNGNIEGLSGPAEGQAAIQDGAAVTVTASGNVAITGDLRYKNRPVTITQDESGMPIGTPADTLIPGNDSGQVLGIFTATGDIQLKNAQPSGNMEIDASLATISSTGTGGLTNVGSTINTLTIVGGRIQNNIKNINSKTRNVFFDRRFQQNGFAPPWFPATTLTSTGPIPPSFVSNFQRVQWLNQTSYF